jgi:hypothetical protein
MPECLIVCIKCAKTHLRASVISKNLPGLYPDPTKNGGPREGKRERIGGGEKRGRGEGRVKEEERGKEGRGAPTLRCLISHLDRES